MKKTSKNLHQAVDLLKLLAHPIRLSILCNLIHRGEMSVGDLIRAEAGSVSQSQVSQFLARLRAADLVACRKDAQTVYYKIKSPQAEKVVTALYNLYCGARLGPQR